MQLLGRDMPVAAAEEYFGQGQALPRWSQSGPAQFGRNSL
jgi:hypothetical protein